MNPLSGIYGSAVRARNGLYARGLIKVQRLQGPVISVGNLSVGGSGKTPFIMLLGDLLKARGIGFDVLSRGYGRQSKGLMEVDPAGDARRFGDEPLLIARKLGVRVIVGEDRYQAGYFSEQKYGPQLHLLDDGFQHRGLFRNVDIILVTPEDARDKLLPAGRLREPLSSMSRAHIIVLTSGAAAEQFPASGQQLWRVRRSIVPHNVPDRPVAFCGIARPKSFFLQLQKAGIEVAAEAVFRDHHWYTEKDIRELVTLKQASDAGGFITTEKDAINLGGYLSALQPLAVVPVRMEIVEPANAVDTIMRMIEERRQRA